MGKVPKHKVERTPEFREVLYDEVRWRILKELRNDALRIMNALTSCGLKPIVHGSVARGDVDKGSDVDVVIPYVVQPYLVELCLERAGLTLMNRYVVQATPAMTPKAYVELDAHGLRTVSFPLRHLGTREWEFYRFGGLLDIEGLRAGKRVPGVNKSLVLIIPTPRGHREAPVIGYEGYVAKVLGISVETVLERVRVLTRRDKRGRTGVFLKYVLAPNESFEEAINRLIEAGKIKI